MSNLGRFVVIIWCFVVLILTQSYTASLTSMLTVQQLTPSITDVQELIKNQESVGYQKDSFVRQLLKQMGFDDTMLKVYGSLEELDELFSNGSRNGGITAAFDEIPCMKPFFAKYCSKYTMVGPTYKTDGFGFVFPIGSPLLHDVSRAVLNVTEGDKMVDIERKWFGKTNCPDSSTFVSSNSLGLESFWGLFLIAGITSLSAFIIFAVVFVHEHKHVLLRSSDPNASIWGKIVELARHFDNKNLSSHTFRKSEPRDKSGIDIVGSMAPQTSPNVNGPTIPSNFSFHATPNCNCPPCPSTSSNHTDGFFRRNSFS